MPLDMGAAAPAQEICEPPREQDLRPATDIESIDDVIADLHKRLSQLSALLDAKFACGEDATDLPKLFALYAQAASRLGRLRVQGE